MVRTSRAGNARGVPFEGRFGETGAGVSHALKVRVGKLREPTDHGG
jgi:hypothetical protein